MDPQLKPSDTAPTASFPGHHSGVGQMVMAPAESARGRPDSVEALVRDGFAAQPLAIALAQQYHLPFKAYLDFSLVDPFLLANVSSEYARKTHILPLRLADRVVVAAVADPSNYGPMDNLAMLFRTIVRPVVVPLDILDYVIARLYHGDNGPPGGPLIYLQNEPLEASAHELSQERMDLLGWNDAPIARLLDAVISEAIAERADRIRFEPLEQDVRVRYRTQHKWYDLLSLPKCLEKAVISCVKVLAGLSSTQTRVRQKGRIRLRSGNLNVIARTFVVPKATGELITLALDWYNEDTTPDEIVQGRIAHQMPGDDIAAAAYRQCARCGDAIVVADARFCRRCGFRLASRFRFRDQIRLVQSFLRYATAIIHG